MQARSLRRPARRTVALGAGAALVTTTLAAATLTAAGPADAVQTYALPSSGNIKIVGHGFGHGHGMSQYGAQGAAAAGLSARQIIAFYYQHTTLTQLAPTTMRVLISGGLSDTTVAPQTGLTLRSASGAVLGPASLPVSGVRRLRLLAKGAGFELDALKGSTWSAVARNLPAQADFRAPGGAVRLYRADGTSTVYRGTVGAVRSGNGQLTINRVGLDDYTAGVVPREMPASWNSAAVHAQALAARTFGLYEKQHSSGAYDVCDNQNCQVYGGSAHYDAAGNLLWTEDRDAISGNQGLVITYGGSPILAQFSASDGGWTTDGGLPYLAARSDPYDTEARSGDPYATWHASVPVSQLAAAYGLAKATSIQITKRDGHGDWGGRVLAAVVSGTDASGHAQSVQTTGFGLQDALGLMQNWFTVDAGMASAPRSVTAVAGDAGATVSWAAPASAGGHTITGYRITAGTVTMTVPAGARSAYVGPLPNAASSTITVRAVNQAGAGQAGSVAVRPAAAERGVRAVNPIRVFDSRSGTTTRVSAAHPYTFRPAGHGSIPATGARSVQLALTIFNPTTSGRLQVVTSGVAAPATQAITYIAGRTSTVTVSVPLVPGGTVRFVPTSGRLDLLGDQTSYSVLGGPAISPVAPVTALATHDLGTSPLTVPLATITSARVYAAVVRVNGSTTGRTPGWVQVWSSSGPTPNTRALSVTPGVATSNLITVPIGVARALKVRGSSAAVHASLTVVGIVGSAASGLLEALPPTPTRDSAAGAARVAGSTIVAAHPAVLALTGTRQLPRTGVAAVLVHLTVVRPSADGSLWMWKAGTARPLSPVMYFGKGHSATATALVPVSSLGHVQLRTSGATVTLAIDTVGYVTT